MKIDGSYYASYYVWGFNNDYLLSPCSLWFQLSLQIKKKSTRHARHGVQPALAIDNCQWEATTFLFLVCEWGGGDVKPPYSCLKSKLPMRNFHFLGGSTKLSNSGVITKVCPVQYNMPVPLQRLQLHLWKWLFDGINVTFEPLSCPFALKAEINSITSCNSTSHAIVMTYMTLETFHTQWQWMTKQIQNSQCIVFTCVFTWSCQMWSDWYIVAFGWQSCRWLWNYSLLCAEFPILHQKLFYLLTHHQF